MTTDGLPHQVLAKFEVKTQVIFDEVRAGGRIPLIIGRGLTSRARTALDLPATTVFRSLGDALQSRERPSYPWLILEIELEIELILELRELVEQARARASAPRLEVAKGAPKLDVHLS